MDVDGGKSASLRLRGLIVVVAAVVTVASPIRQKALADDARQNKQVANTAKWDASGFLFESCTCAVPCTCNFGQGPSPHSYCNSVFAYKLEKAEYDGIDLSGLIIAGSDGPKGRAGVLDDRATAAQRPALEALGRALIAEGGPAGPPRRYQTAKITAVREGNDLDLTVFGFGGFKAKMIVGRDGRTPVVVSNNQTWPIKQAMKAKASKLTFHDADAGDIETSEVNANYGAFAFPEPPSADTPAK